MASIRTARVIAAAASLPLAVALLGGVAHADNGAASATQQVAAGPGATNQSNNANVAGSAFVPIRQSNDVVTVTFHGMR